MKIATFYTLSTGPSNRVYANEVSAQIALEERGEQGSQIEEVAVIDYTRLLKKAEKALEGS